MQSISISSMRDFYRGQYSIQQSVFSKLRRLLGIATQLRSRDAKALSLGDSFLQIMQISCIMWQIKKFVGIWNTIKPA